MADNLIEKAKQVLTTENSTNGTIAELLAAIDANQTLSAELSGQIDELKKRKSEASKIIEDSYLKLERLVPVNPLGNMTIGV